MPREAIIAGVPKIIEVLFAQHTKTLKCFFRGERHVVRYNNRYGPIIFSVKRSFESGKPSPKGTSQHATRSTGKTETKTKT